MLGLEVFSFRCGLPLCLFVCLCLCSSYFDHVNINRTREATQSLYVEVGLRVWGFGEGGQREEVSQSGQSTLMALHLSACLWVDLDAPGVRAATQPLLQMCVTSSSSSRLWHLATGGSSGLASIWDCSSCSVTVSRSATNCRSYASFGNYIINIPNLAMAAMLMYYLYWLKMFISRERTQADYAYRMWCYMLLCDVIEIIMNNRSGDFNNFVYIIWHFLLM